MVEKPIRLSNLGYPIYEWMDSYEPKLDSNFGQCEVCGVLFWGWHYEHKDEEARKKYLSPKEKNG